MATRIRDLFGGGKDRPEGVVQHTVGNALVVHADDAISPEAQSLALSMIEDAENDVVVLDLGDGMPISAWESMAGVLPRRRRGIRLIACGRHGNSAAMAGQWLSERLNRTVIAPDGDLVRGSAGTLFVHSVPGSGWVRFRPGRPPAWDAKRYPTPRWDRAAIDTRPSSATAEIEPIPAGVWIHSNRDPQVVDPQRQRLTAYVPCQPETMTVLLGCPGTPSLSLDDVVRFWRGLDEENRQRVRFVQFGEVRIPEGEAFGQALADLLNTEVTCYTGVPIGSPHRYEIRTVLPDGAFGWAPYALELSYSPRAHPNSRARRPAVLSHRPPLAGAEEVAPRVYWFAPGAVVEVVQTGLWVRSTAEPRNAEQVQHLEARTRQEQHPVLDVLVAVGFQQAGPAGGHRPDQHVGVAVLGRARLGERVDEAPVGDQSPVLVERPLPGGRGQPVDGGAPERRHPGDPGDHAARERHVRPLAA